MKRIGIIGGLGPLATAKFMKLLSHKLINSAEEIEIVVINDPTTPDRTNYILDNNQKNPINNIMNMVKKLEITKCDVIVMPCNTASYFYKEISNNTNLHFINIVQETVNYLDENNINTVGLLATKGTIKSKIYEDLLNEKGINCILPNNNDLNVISNIIYDGVKSNKDVDLNDFYQVCNNLLSHKCEKIILGCTELSALKIEKNLTDSYLLDAMEILANKTVDYIKKDL